MSHFLLGTTTIATITLLRKTMTSFPLTGRHPLRAFYSDIELKNPKIWNFVLPEETAFMSARERGEGRACPGVCPPSPMSRDAARTCLASLGLAEANQHH